MLTTCLNKTSYRVRVPIGSLPISVVWRGAIARNWYGMTSKARHDMLGTVRTRNSQFCLNM